MACIRSIWNIAQSLSRSLGEGIGQDNTQFPIRLKSTKRRGYWGEWSKDGKSDKYSVDAGKCSILREHSQK